MENFIFCAVDEIKNLVKEGKIKNPDMYKDERPVSSNKVYQTLYLEKDRYPPLLWCMIKLTMLIPPNTTDVAWGFSVLALLSLKQRKRLKPEKLDKLMRLIQIGPDWFDDATWELLIDKYDAMGERIFLNQ